MGKQTLVRRLFEGPLDIVGDVHGEIDVLRDLLGHLGYRDGAHPEGRRLVFVGDLTDRGPDSPAVVDFVQTLTHSGQAQCVLGNHELNILLKRKKHENKWFYGEEFLDEQGRPTPQVLADAATRERVSAFFGALPLALERDDLRVIHACWHEAMISCARDHVDVVTFYERYREQIETELQGQAELDEVDQSLLRQNRNPVKLLTSGPERRTATAFRASGKVRREERVSWWEDYHDPPLCVFGHYGLPMGTPRGNGCSFCVDFGIGKRWTERRAGSCGPYEWRLAALRLPERRVIFDNGDSFHSCPQTGALRG